MCPREHAPARRTAPPSERGDVCPPPGRTGLRLYLQPNMPPRPLRPSRPAPYIPRASRLPAANFVNARPAPPPPPPVRPPSLAAWQQIEIRIKHYGPWLWFANANLAGSLQSVISGAVTGTQAQRQRDVHSTCDAPEEPQPCLARGKMAPDVSAFALGVSLARVVSGLRGPERKLRFSASRHAAPAWTGRARAALARCSGRARAGPLRVFYTLDTDCMLARPRARRLSLHWAKQPPSASRGFLARR